MTSIRIGLQFVFFQAGKTQTDIRD